MSHTGLSWRALIEQPYDHYFASRTYEARYPAPNPSTLDFLWRNGVEAARTVLDVGCGNGRYAMPVIERSAADFVGCDISRVALDAFRQRLLQHPDASRVQLVAGEVSELDPAVRFERILMLFGVLSHIGPRVARIHTLRQLRALATPDARLLLTVPSIWRRLPGALLRSTWQPGRQCWGDVSYRRTFGGAAHTFFYHLYSLRALRHELADGGWQLDAVEAESLVAESHVCRSAAWARLDAWLLPLVPAFLGYGIRAVATPLPTQAHR